MTDTIKKLLLKLDAEIADKRLEVENATIDLKGLREKRRAMAMRYCKHEKTYERSVMGREIDKYCEDCGECLT